MVSAYPVGPKIDLNKLFPKEEKSALMGVILFIGKLTVAIVAIGVAVPAIFWGIWYLVVGSIPTFLGFSRFWLDTISGALYAIILAGYVAIMIDEYDELFGDGDFSVSFREFVAHNIGLSLIGVFLIIDFIVSSIFWSLAVGLAVLIFLAIVAGIGYGIWRLFQIIIFGIFCFYGMFVGKDSSAENE